MVDRLKTKHVGYLEARKLLSGTDQFSRLTDKIFILEVEPRLKKVAKEYGPFDTPEEAGQFAKEHSIELLFV